ncbi:hypothetical protein [Hydrogenimonas sp.]
MRVTKLLFAVVLALPMVLAAGSVEGVYRSLGKMEGYYLHAKIVKQGPFYVVYEKWSAQKEVAPEHIEEGGVPYREHDGVLVMVDGEGSIQPEEGGMLIYKKDENTFYLQRVGGVSGGVPIAGELGEKAQSKVEEKVERTKYKVEHKVDEKIDEKTDEAVDRMMDKLFGNLFD